MSVCVCVCACGVTALCRYSVDGVTMCSKLCKHCCAAERRCCMSSFVCSWLDITTKSSMHGSGVEMILAWSLQQTVLHSRYSTAVRGRARRCRDTRTALWLSTHTTRAAPFFWQAVQRYISIEHIVHSTIMMSWCRLADNAVCYLLFTFTDAQLFLQCFHAVGWLTGRVYLM